MWVVSFFRVILVREEIDSMIDAKEAVKIAKEYLSEMYDTSKLRDVLLEEVDMSEDGQLWQVTIGFTRHLESTSEGPMATLIGSSGQYKREYRVFSLDVESGMVKSMKMRSVD